MANTGTERSICKFAVRVASDGAPHLIMQFCKETIPALKEATVGFGLLDGASLEQAKILAEVLNENVRDVFLTVTAEG